MVNIGDKLKKLRLDNKLTQKQVADRVGVVVSGISAYESGERYPSYEILIKLAAIYHVSIDWLLGLSSIQDMIIKTDGLTDNQIRIIKALIDEFQGTK